MLLLLSKLCSFAQIYKNRKMKKFGIILLLATTLISCTQTKIAYVDVEEILKEYKGTKDAEKEMNLKSAEIGKELDAKANAYQAKVSEYYAKAGKMSAKSRQQEEQSLMQQQEVLKQGQQQAQMIVQKEGQDKMTEINEEIEDFVADYAKDNGYTFILGTSDQTKSVLYGDSKSDVTDIILEALNDSYKKENTNATEKEKDTVK